MARLSKLTLTDRQHATIIAALRYWQREGLCGHDVSTEPEHEIATDAGEMLNAEQIDILVDRLNR